MEKLPNCVLSDIFVRLKAKQLAQLRSISKPWNALLSHSSFIKHHLHHSSVLHNNDENEIILLLFPQSFSFCIKKPFKLRSSRTPHLELPNFIKLPVNPQPTMSKGKVIGSVNGLVCFEYEAKNGSTAIYIWNPSLSALLTLPPYSIPSNDNYLIQSFRFGFDPTTNDHKVVKVTDIVDRDPDTDDIVKWLQVQVYSMRRGTWELITQKVPSHLTDIYDQDMVCADGHNGHLHWLACITLDIGVSEGILAFDLGAETFREIPLPDENEKVDFIYNQLGVFTGKLCVMSKFLVTSKFELWVMNEYGVAESWVKLHVFSPCEISPHGFISHHEFLYQDSKLDVALYDSIAATTKLFKFGRPYKWLGKVVPYVDSLVWVSPANCCCSISQFQS